jgi:hypothetical protein
MATSQELGPIWVQKIWTLQTRLDLNGDGKVTWDDFDLMSQRFGTIGNATPDQVTNIHDVLLAMWNQYLAPAAAVGPITKEAYSAALEKQGKLAIAQTVYAIYDQFFRVINTSGSGWISLEEFEVYYKVLGIDVAYAAPAFASMDTDGDGKVTEAEYQYAVYLFYCSNEPSNLWGPLVPGPESTGLLGIVEDVIRRL